MWGAECGIRNAEWTFDVRSHSPTTVVVVSAIPFACWKVDSRFWFTRSRHCKNGRQRFDCQNDRRGVRSDFKSHLRFLGKTMQISAVFPRKRNLDGCASWEKPGTFVAPRGARGPKSRCFVAPAVLAGFALPGENRGVLPILLALRGKNAGILPDFRAGACRPEARQESLSAPLKQLRLKSRSEPGGRK